VVLADAALNAALAARVSVSNTPFADVYGESLRQRVASVPRILSDGKFILDKTNPNTRALDALLCDRNNLLHRREEPFVITPKNSRLSKDGTELYANIESIFRNYRQPPAIETVRTYARAVEVYFDKILFRLTEATITELPEGQRLIMKITAHGIEQHDDPRAI